MATATEVTAAKLDAQLALFKLIESSTRQPMNVQGMERLARAYRYAAGGPQPGSPDAE